MVYFSHVHLGNKTHSLLLIMNTICFIDLTKKFTSTKYEILQPLTAADLVGSVKTVDFLVALVGEGHTLVAAHALELVEPTWLCGRPLS